MVSLRRLSDIVDDSQAGDADVARYFDEVAAEQGMRPSVEALLHVVCVVDAGATTVAHTHPESVNALLCSDRAEVLAGPPIFPDQVVVMGRRGLLIPYSDPGVVLARGYVPGLQNMRARGACRESSTWKPRSGCPRLQRGAGLAADGDGRQGESCCGSGTRLGNVVPMTDESAERIDTRDDEQIRRIALSRATLQQPETIEQDVGDPRS